MPGKNQTKVIGALDAGQLTLEQLAAATNLSTKTLAALVLRMTKSGALLRTGEPGGYEYALNAGTASSKGAGRKKTKKAKAVRAGGARKAKKVNRAAPAAPRVKRNGTTANVVGFGISDDACLGITVGDKTIRLEGAGHITALRDFIDKTCTIWDPQ